MVTRFAAAKFNCNNDHFLFVCGYPKFVKALIFSELQISNFLVGNFNHPDVAYFQCVFGLEIEREFLPMFTSEITEVKQTACEKFGLFLIALITNNHR